MVESGPTLEDVFKGFSGGKSEMSTKEFLKLNKDCGFIDKHYTSTDVDLIFTKSKSKTSKVLTYEQFTHALGDIATKKKIDTDAVIEKIITAGGPTFTGTKADYVKFHDDKTLYTGVYANGGPTNVDIGNGIVSDISQTCDRSSSDVRGVKKTNK